MYTPKQLGQLSLGLDIAGMLTGAIGGFYSAKAQRSSLQFQADIAEINARIAELGAQQELIRGEKEVGRLTLRAGQLKGRQRVALAANGVDLGEGTAAEVQASADLMKELDRQTIETNAVMAAWGHRTQAAGMRSDAAMRRVTASGISPFGSAMGTLLGGAGRVAGKWYEFNKAGVFDSGGMAPIVDLSTPARR